MKLYLIRHLKTKGNYERKYIGRTDESLFAIDEQSIISTLPVVEALFTSPMKRCIETSKIILPEIQPTIVKDLREIDFGDFENKSYEELKDNPEYIKFINSNGAGKIPNGENTADFKNRCCEAFLQIIKRMEVNNLTTACIVCHGGTIMSIMEQFDEKAKSYYDYQVKNGSGYETEFDIESQKIIMIKEWNG